MASAVKTNKVDKEEELTVRMKERTPSAAGALLGQRLGAPPKEMRMD